MDFTKKVVLVTGASGGIGGSIGKRFAKQGANVAFHYNRNKESVEAIVSALPRGKHEIVQADLTRSDEAKMLVETVIQKMGTIDILVNNAGVYDQHPILSLGYEEWNEAWFRTIRLNLLGPAHLIFCAVHHMLKGNGGRIVSVSSRGAFRGEPLAPAYGASKAGLNAMSQSLAKALASRKIYFFVVAPGFVDTERVAPMLEGPGGDEIRRDIPFGRVALPDEVARAVLFLASEGSEYMTGCIVDLNGASYLRS